MTAESFPPTDRNQLRQLRLQDFSDNIATIPREVLPAYCCDGPESNVSPLELMKVIRLPILQLEECVSWNDVGGSVCVLYTYLARGNQPAPATDHFSICCPAALEARQS